MHFSHVWECLAEAYLHRGSLTAALKAFTKASDVNIFNIKKYFPKASDVNMFNISIICPTSDKNLALSLAEMVSHD